MLFQCVWLFAFAKSVYFSVNGIRWGDEVGTTCLLILCTIDASIKLVPIEFRPFEGECTPPHKTCWGNGSECQRGYDKLRFEIYTHLQCFILHLPFFHCGGNAGQSEPRIGSWNWCCIPCSAGRIHLSLEDALRRSRWTSVFVPGPLWDRFVGKSPGSSLKQKCTMTKSVGNSWKQVWPRGLVKKHVFDCDMSMPKYLNEEVTSSA